MGSLSATILDRLAASNGVGPAIVGFKKMVYAFEPTGYDKTNSTESQLYWTDSGYTSGAGDTPAHTHMAGRMIVPNLGLSLVDVSAVKRGSPEPGEERGLPGLANLAIPTQVVVEIINVDVNSAGTAPLDEYLDRDLWSFAGRKGLFKIGANDLAYTAFEEIMGGEWRIAGEPTWSPEGNPRFVLDPPVEGFGQPFQTHIYGGFGAGLVFNGTDVEVDYGNEWNFGEMDGARQWRIRWPDNANQRVIEQKRATLTGGTDAGHSLYIDTSKQLIFSASDGTSSGSINMGAASAYDDDVYRMFTVVYDHGTQFEAFVSAFDSSVPKAMVTTSLGTIDTSSWTGVVTNSETMIQGREVGAASWFDGDMDEFRVWRKTLTNAQINDSALQTCAGNENKLDACYKMDDRTSAGATAWQEVITGGLVSIEFDAGTEQVSFGDIFDQDPSSGGAADSFTFGIWAKVDSISGEDFLFGNRSAVAATNTGLQLSFTESSGDVSLRFRLDDGTNRYTATSTSAKWGRGVWHFFAGRCDASAKTIEAIVLDTRDGQLEVSATADITGIGSCANANALVWGRSAAGTLSMTGQVGRGFFLELALTDAQILALARYAWGVDTISPSGDMVTLYNTAVTSSFWNVDEGSSTTVADAWDVGNDGTITGSRWLTQDATINGTAAWTSSLDGDAGLGERADAGDLQGKRVQHAWGRFRGAECHLLDQDDDGVSTATPYYGFADPLHAATKAMEDFYSGGLVLTGGGSDYNAPDLTANTVQLTAPQDEVITCDGKGYVDGSGDLIETTADIAEQLFDLVGETTHNAASFTQLNIDVPYQVGLVTGLEPYLTEEVIDAHLRPISWATKNISGEILVGSYKNLDGETPDLTLTASQVVRNGITEVLSTPPASRVDVAFRRQWRPLTSFLGAVSTPDQQRQRRSYWQTGTGGGGILTEHKDAVPVYVSSHIHRRRDAQELAETIRDILNRPMQVLRVRLARDLFKAEIGDIVKLTYPRFGLSAGKLFLCVGYTYPKEPSLLLWGPFELT